MLDLAQYDYCHTGTFIFRIPTSYASPGTRGAKAIVAYNIGFAVLRRVRAFPLAIAFATVVQRLASRPWSAARAPAGRV